MKNHITWTNVMYSLAVAVLGMFILWQHYDSRVIFLFVLALSFSEVFIQLRWRLGLKCPYCGFDPILYKKNASLAAQRVKAYLEQQKENPDVLLSKKNPFLTLPKKKITPGESTQKLKPTTKTQKEKESLLSVDI